MGRHSTANFTKLFDQLARTHSRGPVFTDFLDYALQMFNWAGKADFSELESKYKLDGMQIMAAMLQEFSIVADNNGVGFYDALGDLFMEYLSSDRSGQFFTPPDICNMMAALIVGDNPPDGTSVCDPTCGSGRTLLAAAKVNRRMRFYGADLDIVCCKMSVLNLLLNSMEGEIAWMNSLSMEHWKSWHIGKVLGPGGHYIPYYYESGPGETHFIERLKNTLQTNGEDIKVDKKNQLMLF